MTITLELPSGEQLSYESNNLIVGSDIACDILIDHEDVHEQHCRIRKMAGRWIVESMGDWEIRAGLGEPGLKAWIQATDDLYLTPVGPVLIFEPLPHPAGYDPTAKTKAASKATSKATAKPAASTKPTAAPVAPTYAPSGEVDWLCIINDQGHGPVTQSELQRLAKSGQLRPADLVWRVGLADWTPASEVAELISPFESTNALRHSDPQHASSQLESLLPDTTNAHFNELGQLDEEHTPSFLAGLFARTNATERLAVKQAEFTKLTSITLPAAYHELGESNYENGYFRDAFHGLFSKIQTLNSELKQLTTKSRADADGGNAEMVAMISVAKVAADRRKLTQQREQALVALGKAAYDQYGEQAGIAKLVSNVNSCLTHIETLDTEISKLNESGGGIILTPLHYAIGGVAGVLLLIFIVIGISLAINAKKVEPAAVTNDIMSERLPLD